MLGALAVVVEGCAAHRPPITPPQPPAPTVVTPPARATTFVATAYCHGTITAAGVGVHEGIVAADPAVLPLGTIIHIERTGRHDGVYTVLDTGSNVQGRRLDLFIRDCAEARRFGRRTVRVWIGERASHAMRE